ncbi:hypothetical protein GQX74_012262 [Glossina fuscipes]|uniref:Uncharacterized protein n=1 Tax=Glossina palpalis gambiensis TaxID=67801 RepID=A0A1B0BZX4_9MUSC|nr:hypothetical protein GQX74_012262 [Glossina fuscipes]
MSDERRNLTTLSSVEQHSKQKDIKTLKASKSQDSASFDLTEEGSIQNENKTIRPQMSFEERYTSIIQENIFENTINREAVQRQMQNFFPGTRTLKKTEKINNEPPIDVKTDFE